jgi:hypothetical protein
MPSNTNAGAQIDFLCQRDMGGCCVMRHKQPQQKYKD